MDGVFLARLLSKLKFLHARCNTWCRESKHQSTAKLWSCCVQVAWKLSNVKVLCSEDAGKDDHTVTVAVASAASKMLHARETLPTSAVSVLRKAYDPRPLRSGNHKRKGVLHFL